MRIREYQPADFDALRQMHAAQGFGYPLPDLDSPLFAVKLVLEDEENGAPGREEENHPSSLPAGLRANELPAASHQSLVTNHESRFTNHDSPFVSPPSKRVKMAVLLRLTAETYLLHDPRAGTPRGRWRNLLALHEAARHRAFALGLDDVQAFLPPRVARAFGRRLGRLGWRQDPWPCFSRLTRS